VCWELKGVQSQVEVAAGRRVEVETTIEGPDHVAETGVEVDLEVAIDITEDEAEVEIVEGLEVEKEGDEAEVDAGLEVEGDQGPDPVIEGVKRSLKRRKWKSQRTVTKKLPSKLSQTRMETRKMALQHLPSLLLKLRNPDLEAATDVGQGQEIADVLDQDQGSDPRGQDQETDVDGQEVVIEGEAEVDQETGEGVDPVTTRARRVSGTGMRRRRSRGTTTKRRSASRTRTRRSTRGGRYGNFQLAIKIFLTCIKIFQKLLKNILSFE